MQTPDYLSPGHEPDSDAQASPDAETIYRDLYARLLFLSAEKRQERRRRRVRAVGRVAVVTTFLALVTSGLGAFQWGGQTWKGDEGRQFIGWLNRHGTTAPTFRENHPELANDFGRNWPRPPAERRVDDCRGDAACVIREVFPDATEDKAIAIANCESGLNPRAVGDNGNSFGLFQIHYPSWSGKPWVGTTEQLRDAEHNARVALRISGGGRDWGPWSCRNAVRVVSIARSLLGTPYVWGTDGPGTFDCSGLTRYLYAALGIDLPHRAAIQAGLGKAVTGRLEWGDLVFFGSPVHHVGVFVGAGRFIHAPHSGATVRVDRLSERADVDVVRRFL